MVIEINLLDYFPIEQIYVKIRNYEEFFRQAFKIRSKLPRTFIQQLRSKRGFKLTHLQFLIKKIDQINDIVTHVKIGRYGKFIKLPLKFRLNEEWFYISELIRTDGHISSNFVETKLTNNDMTLLSKFENFCKSLEIVHIRKERDRYRVFNVTLALILNKLFEIQAGNKSLETYFPTWMKQTDKTLISSALSGAFDGDGSVQHDKHGIRRVRLNTGSFRYAKDIQECLSKFNIVSSVFKDPREGRNVWYVQVSDKLSLIKFKENIGFLQPERAKKLRELIASYQRFPIEEFETKIHELLRINKKLTISQIAKLMKRSPTTISEQITKLESRKAVKTERIGNKRLVELIS